MQTTPPMVMASAPKAGAVHPLTRKIAAVAMSVAMVMPETGDWLRLPTMPTMREETVTNRNPKTTTQQRSGEVGERADLRARDGLELRKRNMKTTSRTLPPSHDTGEGRSCSIRERRLRFAPFPRSFLKPWRERADDGWERAEQRDEARRRRRLRLPWGGRRRTRDRLATCALIGLVPG